MKRKRTSSLTTPFGRNTVALRIPVQGVSCRRRVVGGFEITTITPSSLQQYTQAKANIKEDKTRGIKAVSYSQGGVDERHRQHHDAEGQHEALQGRLTWPLTHDSLVQTICGRLLWRNAHTYLVVMTNVRHMMERCYAEWTIRYPYSLHVSIICILLAPRRIGSSW